MLSLDDFVLCFSSFPTLYACHYPINIAKQVEPRGQLTAFSIFSAVRRWLAPLWPRGLPSSCSSADDGLSWRVSALPFLALLALAILRLA